MIRNPIDLFHLRKCAADHSDEAELAPAAFNLVSAGRLEAQKGFDVAIEAIKLTKHREINLTILGEGQLRMELECRFRDFTGRHSDQKPDAIPRINRTRFRLNTGQF